jgi:hypothetical protein
MKSVVEFSTRDMLVFKVSDFGAFWISDFWIGHAEPVQAI